MNWRWDWILFATGLISLGICFLARRRGELMSLLGGEASQGGASGVLEGYWLPVCLLTGLVGRLGYRLIRRR